MAILALGYMGTVDVVLVATKAWQVPEIAPDLQALLHKDTFVVPLQNGVEAADQLAKALGNERVVGGLCGVMAFIEAPGVIRHAAIEPFISFGERDGQRWMPCFPTAMPCNPNLPRTLQRRSGKSFFSSQPSVESAA